ncbi:MAG: VanZ family protein [Bacilli bacterium]
MLREQILEVILNTWPMILICMVIIITLRITYFIKNKTKPIIYKELLSAAFIIYVLCLFYVVTFQDVNYANSNFIPFKEMFRYDFGTRLFIKNIIGNIVLFIPYGFFIGYYLKLEKFKLSFLLTLVVSITIETTQLAIGRVFDIDDILLNVIGGLLGTYVYTVLSKIKGVLPASLQKSWFYNIIILLISVIFVLYLFKLGV